MLPVFWIEPSFGFEKRGKECNHVAVVQMMAMGRDGLSIRNKVKGRTKLQGIFLTFRSQLIGKRKEWNREFIMPKAILIVEDNEDAIRILQDRLEVWGYHVIIAHTAEEGLQELKKKRVVGVIYELRIPVTEALMALSQFHQQYPLIPIIATSEETQRVALIEALEQGANDYVIKPIDFEVLQGKCQRLFE